MTVTEWANTAREIGRARRLFGVAAGRIAPLWFNAP